MKGSKLSKKAVMGSGATHTYLVKLMSKALFVTRFDPAARVSDAEGLLKEGTEMASVKCTQLKTRKEGFNSFHLEV